MLDLNQKEHIARLYRLFIMVSDGMSTLKKAIKASVLRRGTDINLMYAEDEVQKSEIVQIDDDEKKDKGRNTAATSADAASKWVEGILNLKDVFDQVWRQCFNSDHQIETVLNDVCSIPFFLYLIADSEIVVIPKFHQPQSSLLQIYISIY